MLQKIREWYDRHRAARIITTAAKGVASLHAADIAADIFFNHSPTAYEAQAQEIAAGINVDIVTKWMYRGSKVAGPSVQPSIYVAHPSGLTGIIWSSDSLKTPRFDEIDAAIEYTKNVKGIDLTAGFNRYSYIGAEDENEVYGKVSFSKLPFMPTVLAVHDLEHGNYFEASGSKNLSEGITASVAVGCKNNYYGDSNCPNHLDLRVQKELELKGFRIRPGVQWTIGEDNNVIGILSIGKDF